MRDRAEDRGLDRVAAPEGLGLQRLSRQPLSLVGNREQRGEGREESPPYFQICLRMLVRVDGADRRRPDRQWIRRHAFLGLSRPTQLDPSRADPEDLGYPGADPFELFVEVASLEQMACD